MADDDRPDTTGDTPGYVCTLTPEEVPDRVAQVAQLSRGLLDRERDGQQVRLRFDPALAPVLEEFVRDESECCSFYEFDVEHTAEAVALSVRAPAEAEELLTGLYEVFGPAE